MGVEESKIESIFYAALEKNSAVERAAYLDEACSDDSELRGRVELLLDAQPNLGRFLENDAVGAPPFDQPLAEQPGTVIGPYKLIEEIGEGGMGSVFMALQKEPVRRKVALKVIKPGMDSRQVVSRFEAERQALAMMDHPNIARVFDGGSTESGRPYFVMELVNGIPVTDYCDRYRLTTNERLELFGDVCSAVQHAHQKGIIHRDLKPSNILVTLLDGRAIPKVIDFGIAKATRGHLTDESLVTHFAQMIGSPLYMSPEQAELSGADVDTRSDVYLLGVLLYELLTCNTPFDRERMSSVSFDKFRRIIREEEPPKPSTCLSTLDGALETVADKHHTDPRTLSHEVAGELDWIVMKALEKDRTRRYETASDLAKDVRRYLDDEAVEACPPSTAYRLGKFARRHKARLAAIAAVLALFVVGIVGGSAVAWNRHRQKTELARAVNKELDDARQSLEAGDLADAERKLTAARTRLDAARYDVEHLQTDVARLSKEVSAKTRAQKRFDEFEQIRERVFSRMYDLHKQEMQQAAKDCRTALDLFNIFGPADWKRQPAYRNLHEQRQQTLEDHVVELMFVMARLEVWTVTPDAWTILDDEDRRVVVDAAAHRRAIEVLERIETVSGPTAGVYAFLGQCWRELGQKDEVQKTDAAGKELQPTTALDYYILGELLAKRGSRERALERYGQSLGREPAHYLSLLAMGDTLEKLGQLQAAEMALTGAITANPRPTFSYIKRALIRLRQDKRDLALADFAEAARRDPTLAEDYFDRGHWNLENGDLDQALSDWTAAIGLDPENAAAYFHRGLLYSDPKGKFDHAITDFSKAIQLDPGQAEAYYNRGIAYDHQGKFDLAAADFGTALTRGLTRPEVYTRRGTAHALSGSAQLALDDYGEALRLDPYYAPAFFERGIVLCDCLGEFERAIADFDAAIRINPKQPLACYNRAVACAAKGDLEGAVAGWTEAIWLDPRFARAYFERGILYCNGLDEFGKAVADFNQVLQLAPELLSAYYNRGIACYNRGDRGQALASWTRAIGLGFTRIEIFCSRGILYAERRELQKAIADFDEAIRIDPQYAPAYNHRAAARAALGQAQKAADDRAEAARLLEIQQQSTPNSKAAGEVSLTTTPLTGQASPRRLVCASEEMMSCILRRTGSLLESQAMFFLPLLRKLSRPGAMRTGQAHLRHFPRLLQPRRLRHEPLEARHLLSAVSGTVFEDLDADGVRDAGEGGLEGWTAVLDRTDTPELLQTFLNPTPEEDDLFGFSVAAVGDNVVVGAFRDDTGATDAGAAYLFDGATGDLLQTFLNPTPEEDDYFGLSVGALGDKVLVGANGDNTNGERAGAAYMFDGATGDLLQTFLDPTPHPTAGAHFGWSFAAVGDNVLISAPWNLTPTIPSEGGAGAAYLFHGSTGEHLQTFLNPTPEVLDAFGYLAAPVGSNILISAPWDDTGATDAGAAYLFDGTTGELLRTFLNPTPENSDEFGISVAVVGTNVLIGAWLDDTGATDAGIVYLFDSTTGELLRTFVSSRPEDSDRFGTKVAAVGNNVLIGARGDNINATSDGAAYLFDATTGELLQSFLNPTPEGWDMLGWSVAAVGDNILTGVPWDNAGASDAGAAHLFEGVSSAATDANGNYNFTGLEDGTYRIWQVSPEGYFQTAPGGDGSDMVIIAGGVPVAGPDFGMAPTTTGSYDNNVPKDLKDAKNAVRPGITQSTLTIADSHRIVDLNVDLSITHPRPEDLDVFLIAPDGTRVELFSDVAGAGSTITLDDEAPRSIVDAPYQFADAYRPEGSLAAVDGTSTEGTWTLEIADDTKGEVGSLESWSLTIEQVPFPPPPPGPPTIDSLSDNPDPVKQGQSLTLTANGVVDDGEVTSVAFYRDDGDGSFGAGDTLLATDTDAADGWAATIGIPSDFATGVYTYFAQATDNELNLGNVVSTTNEVKRAKGGGKPKSLSADASLAADRLFASSALALDFADLLVDDRLFPTTRQRHAKRSSVDLVFEDITVYTFDEELANDLALAII